MDSVDLDVLKRGADWLDAGHRALLVTVVQTFGSSPRPEGAMLAVRDDGLVVGSVSGGCIEDDIVGRTRREGQKATKCEVEAGRLTARRLTIADGSWTLQKAAATDGLTYDGKVLTTIHGPRYRMLVIGASQLSKYLAQIAVGLDYHVTICDPRDEYTETWDVPGVALVRTMPDDTVQAMRLDERCAVVALTHDPKLDDLALLEALKSPAFYVGALGSRANNAKRRERLHEFDLTEAQIARLHGPIGLYIGSRTPPEIAVSILAEITAVKNGVDLEAILPVATAKALRAATPACSSAARRAAPTADTGVRS